MTLHYFIMFWPVQIIIVHKNPVAAIHSAAFQCLTHLTTLSINSPLLRMAPSLQDIRQSLTILVLAHSKVKSGPDYLNGAHIQTLWLQHCDLTAIPASIDSLVSSLRRLDISDNYVTTLKPLHGVHFDKLSTLSLHRNSIVHIDSERLFLPPLCVVYLQHNLLTTLSEPNNSGALTAFLEGNPWHCNASLGWLLRGLHSGRFGAMHYHHKESDVLLRDVHRWTCTTPSLYQRRPVVEVLPIVATLANKGENDIPYPVK